MNSAILQALMMGMNGGGMGAGPGMGGAPGLPMPAAGGDTGGDSPFGQGGMSPQLLQFASGALTGGGLQGGVGKLLGGMLAQKMKQRLVQQMPGGGDGNPLSALLSGDPGSGGQPMV